MNRIYICIDLKSFYASVECVERGLDPLKTNLVVADRTRTEKTICLAVSPSLKKYGISGRARLYEVVQKVKEINLERKKNNNNKKFINKSINEDELNNNKDLELDYLVAIPRMSHYMKYSTDIYNIYLKYVAPEDIYAYSIDEVFCDITNYLNTYKLNARSLLTKMINEVYETTGITATGGIGTNMYLAKVAMDIVAKKMEANKYGVRIAGLDEITYRKLLWNYKPITSFWRVGKGISKRLENNNIYTMGDIAKVSLENEELLYKLFGINAELLIDHAWGIEPTTIKDVKEYRPKINSISSGQVLKSPYNYKNTKLIVKEMVDNITLDLVRRNIVTDQIVLNIGYDIENDSYQGEYKEDMYGRKVPKSAHGTIRMYRKTSSYNEILKYTLKLFEEIINKDLYVRRINITCCNTINRDKYKNEIKYEQFNLFEDYTKKIESIKEIEEKEIKENNLQKTLIEIKEKYGKNSILKGMNLEKGGTMIERNAQIGGHRA